MANSTQGTTDLFGWLDALWNKKRPEGTFPVFVAHRFLASDKDLAIAAREFSHEIREPDLIFRTWQGSLPKGRGAPRLQYTAARKPPAEEALVARMKLVLAERREVVEDTIELVKLVGREEELYQEFGIEREDTNE